MSSAELILQGLLQTLADCTRRPVLDFNAQAVLLSAEVGLDSLATLEFVTALESQYGLRFDTEEAEQAMGGSIAELAVYIAATRSLVSAA